MNFDYRPKEDIIGVDVGGSKIAVGLVSSGGHLVHSSVTYTDVRSESATLDSIANAVKHFIAKHEITLSGDAIIGFGIPGLVDPEKGIGIASVNLNWKNVPVRSELISRLNVNCVIDNDVRVGAIGEAIYGLAKNTAFFIYLNVGTGVSAVVVDEGKIFTGMNGLAGEIGHAVFIPDGPLCKCGGHGCLEALVSGPAIAQRAQNKLQTINGFKGEDVHLESELELTPRKVFIAAGKGEKYALDTIREVGDLLAYSLQHLALAYDPQMIVLAGGVIQGGEFLTDYVHKRLNLLADASWVFGKLYNKDLVKVSALGSHAGIFGAAALVVMEDYRKEKII